MTRRVVVVISKPDCPECGTWDNVEHEGDHYWWCSGCAIEFELDAISSATETPEGEK